MKKKYAVIAGSLLLALLVCAAFLYGYGRERSLKEICPLSADEPVTGAALYRSLPAEDASAHVELTQEQFQALIAQMDTIQYKKIGSTNAMGQDENYATLNYTVDQEKMEIMFSDADGGRMLVNVVSENGNAPLYQMVPSGEAIQKMILGFFHAAHPSNG